MKALPENVKKGLSCVKKSTADLLLQLEDKYGRPEKAAQQVVDYLKMMDHKKMAGRVMTEFSIKLEDI